MEYLKLYTISPLEKKSVYQTEKWTNLLSNGKKVILENTTFFRNGDFEVELTMKEKEELMKKDNIILNDYSASCNELWDGCDSYQEIVHSDKFTKLETEEIHKLLYFNSEEPENYDNECDDRIDEDILDSNGWSMDDTIYGITCKCKIEEIQN